MEPNYALSTEDLYTIFAHKVLDQDTALSLLSSVQHGDELDTSWPTWIPQWDKVYTTSLAPSEPDGNTSGASRGTTSVLTISKPHAIAVGGLQPFIVDKVLPKRTSSTSDPYLDDTVAEYEAFKQRKEPWIHANGRPIALCWTLTAGKRWDAFPISDVDEQLADFAAYIRTDLPRYASLVSECNENGDQRRFKQAAASACDGRRLFVTTSGHLGIGPAVMKNGDLVCVLFGANVPYILRPNEDHFFLIGECYMHSLADGQVIDTRNAGHLEDREFLLH
jgi:hypothetical protein